MEFDAFLAYNSADKDEVRRLHDRLQRQGLRVWRDETDLRPGDLDQEGLEAGILCAGATLVCVAGSGIGPWQRQELRAGLALAVRKARRVIPVLLPGAAAEPDLPPFLGIRTWVDLRGGIDSDGVARLVWGITGNRAGDGPAPYNPRDQLPADLPDFTGRTADRDWLESRLTPGASVAVCALGGQGGIGKTALAVHCAHRVKGRFPDGVIVIPLGGAGERPVSPVEALAWVIRAFESQRRLPEDPDQVQAIYRQVLQGRRVLILADDAATTAQVERLAPSPPAVLLITSRRRIALGPVRDLDVLAPDEARTLLAGILDAARPVGTGDLDRLAAACGRLPLALRVAGAYRVLHPEVPLDDYLAMVEDETTRLAALDCEGLPRGRVGAVLAVSAGHLLTESPAFAARWQALAVFPAPFDLPAAAAVWGLAEPRQAQRPLGDLIDRGLLRWDGALGRYRLHDLLRPIAAAPWDWCRCTPGADGPTPGRLTEARGRHAAHYLGVLRAACDRYLEGHDGVTAGLAAYDADAVQIAAGQAWAAAGEDEAAMRLALDYPDAGAYVLSLRLHPRERVRWLETGLAAARRLGERRLEGNHLGNLGLAWADLGEPRKAIGFYEQQLVIVRDIGDRRGEGSALGNLGNAWADLGELRNAIGFYEQQLFIVREIGDRRGEGYAVGNLGGAWADLGEPRKAIGFHEQHLVIAREIGDRLGEAIASHNLGNAQWQVGEPQAARRQVEHALALFASLESPHAETARRWLAAHP